MPAPPANTTDRPLVVDLDGTLCRTDTLWESFFVAWKQCWWLPFAALFWALAGRNTLKQRIAAIALPDVAQLPWRPEVITALQSARTEGRRCVLATAADRQVAEACAHELRLFDQVLASDSTINLKGRHKAVALTGLFGAQGFDYVGDSRADVPVWTAAHPDGRFTVSRLRPEGIQALSQPAQTDLSTWLRLLRVRHWVKNVLVFVALLAAHVWNNPQAWLAAFMAFAAFCLVCSGVYVFNDLFDLAADRAHPSKSQRPLASGVLPLYKASVIATLLLGTGLTLGFAITPKAGALILLYVALNVLYTLALKRVPLLDVFLLAVLYTLRIICGALVIAVPLSPWLIAFSLFAFLSLALLKRTADLLRLAPDETLAGRGWQGRDTAFVNAFGIGCALAASLVLALYIASDQVTALYRQPLWLWGVAAIVLFWLARAWYLTGNGRMDDDPVLFATQDRTSWICMGLMVLCIALGT